MYTMLADDIYRLHFTFSMKSNKLNNNYIPAVRAGIILGERSSEAEETKKPNTVEYEKSKVIHNTTLFLSFPTVFPKRFTVPSSVPLSSPAASSDM